MEKPMLPKLDLNSLLAEARKTAQLDDFGDSSFLEPLSVLINSLNEEAGLNSVGLATQHERLVNILVSRLRIQDYFSRYPEIADEKIKDTVAIVGFARTGTTMLQRCLAADKRFYAPLWYEVRFPAPFPGWDFNGPDPRIAAGKAEVAAVLEAQPDLAAIHPWDATAADEEIMLLEHAFYSTMPEVWCYLPSYQRWQEANDNTPGYEYLKQVLQFLQWQKKRKGHKGGQRWVLKTPHHLHFLDTLLKVFPDTKIIQTHRDPQETIPSLCSMIYNMWAMGRDETDPHLVGHQFGIKWANSMRRTMAVRDQDPTRFMDVWYKDAVTEPVQVVKNVYQFLDMPFSDADEANLQQHLQANKREHRPAHRYSPEQFGFNTDWFQENFSEYRARFLQGN